MRAFVSPVTGTWAAKSNSPFGASRSFGTRYHAGNDLQAKDGSPAVAAVGGKVVYAGHNQGYQWNAVVVDNDGNAYRYATHGPLAVKVGQVVEAGQKIGSIAREHLHFEVIPAGSATAKKMASSPGEFVSTKWGSKGKASTVDPAAFFGVKKGAALKIGAPIGNPALASMVPEKAPRDPFGVTAFQEGKTPPGIAAVNEMAAGKTPRTLRKGMQGDDVRQLQQQLAAAGLYKGKIDGDYGRGTQAAVKKAEAQYGLSFDKGGVWRGVAGPQVQAALRNQGSIDNIMGFAPPEGGSLTSPMDAMQFASRQDPALNLSGGAPPMSMEPPPSTDPGDAALESVMGPTTPPTYQPGNPMNQGPFHSTAVPMNPMSDPNMGGAPGGVPVPTSSVGPDPLYADDAVLAATRGAPSPYDGMRGQASGSRFSPGGARAVMASLADRGTGGDMLEGVLDAGPGVRPDIADKLGMGGEEMASGPMPRPRPMNVAMTGGAEATLGRPVSMGASRDTPADWQPLDAVAPPAEVAPDQNISMNGGAEAVLGRPVSMGAGYDTPGAAWESIKGSQPQQDIISRLDPGGGASIGNLGGGASIGSTWDTISGIPGAIGDWMSGEPAQAANPYEVKPAVPSPWGVPSDIMPYTPVDQQQSMGGAASDFMPGGSPDDRLYNEPSWQSTLGFQGGRNTLDWGQNAKPFMAGGAVLPAAGDEAAPAPGSAGIDGLTFADNLPAQDPLGFNAPAGQPPPLPAAPPPVSSQPLANQQGGGQPQGSGGGNGGGAYFGQSPGAYSYAGQTQWGSPQYYTGSSYSNSPFTPMGFSPPDFDQGSGGPTYAYKPDGMGGGTYIDSQGNVRSY